LVNLQLEEASRYFPIGGHIDSLSPPLVIYQRGAPFLVMPSVGKFLTRGS